MNDELYTTQEVALMLGIEKQSVSMYFRKFGIGTKDLKTGFIFYTKEEIEQIKNKDGRRDRHQKGVK